MTRRASERHVPALAVFVVLLSLGAAMSVWVHGLVQDQERRLLRERGSAAALVLTANIASINPLMAQLGTAVRVATVAPDVFAETAASQVAASPTIQALAVLRPSGAGWVVQMVAGPGLAVGQVVSGPRSAAAQAATQSPTVASTGVFTIGPDLLIGFAIGPPTALPGTVLYRESRIQPGTPTKSTSTAPFAELNAELYAGPKADPTQLVVATARRPAPGDLTYTQMVPVGDTQWLFSVSAKHTLVGSLVGRLPWAVAAAALVASMLVAGVLDVLLRRRDYALALVDRRTAELKESLVSLELARFEASRARDGAMEASRLKSQFLANMSHEIRTPLNGVIGMTGLLLDSHLGPEEREFAETARRSGEVLLDLINDILDFSKIEAGKMELEASAFDLAAIVEDVAELFAPAAQQKGLELTTSTSPDLPGLLLGDPVRVRQVLTNLVGNAIKFTEVGDVAITATVDRVATPPLVRCEVRDTGIGIEPGQQERLFESFTQADASTTRRFGGTGLGLAISKRLAEMMGGAIGVRSQVGGGSKFWFTMPYEPASDHLELPADAAALSGLRALIVDDNPTNRTILERQVTAWAIESVAVADGPAALRALREGASSGRNFDFVLLDRDMPDMDGLDVVAVVAADRSLDSVRVVMLTSVGSMEAPPPRIAATLTKPVRRAQLFNTVASAMGIAARLPYQDHAGLSATALWRPPHGLRALVVEDHPVNQRVVAAMLERLGLRVDVAGDGIEAVAAVAHLPYDVVLMDCQMPMMNGYEATEEIRRRETGGRRVPIIALTALAMKGDEERCLAAGMDAYVSKPVRTEDLAHILRTVLALPPVGGPEGTAGADPVDLDPETVGQLRALGGDLLRSIAVDFRRASSEDIESLKSALARGESANVYEAAHRLKGACLMVGALRMSQVASEIEAQALAGELERVSELAAALEGHYETAMAALDASV